MKIFLNFKKLQALSYIWIQKLFQRLIWINYQNCKKKLICLRHYKRQTTAKSPYFYNICTFGFGFGIRPKARSFSGQIFGFGLKWKTYFRSFTVRGLHAEYLIRYLFQTCLELILALTLKFFLLMTDKKLCAWCAMHLWNHAKISHVCGL